MIVFLHGVPEVSSLWDELRALLAAESVALSLPGFGTPRPLGFAATKDDYVDWTLGQLADIDEPIDLVGHDWGAIITNRIATAYGDRVRSWVSDGAFTLSPDYEWHDLARLWQTPGDGEEFWAGQLATPVDDRAAVLSMLGMPSSGALRMAAALDDTMTKCIMDLYRSATPNPYADWTWPLRPTQSPGLILSASDDPFGNTENAKSIASALEAHFVELPGLGHWWALEDPALGADVLQSFWASVDAAN